MNTDYRDRVASEGEDFLSCLDERGWGEWEFILNGLAVGDFLENAGWHTKHSYEGAEGTYPDPPDDLPTDDEDWFEFEVAMAVDFAECGDETGFREAATEAWEQAQMQYYLEVEAETYAWHEELQGYLDNAQDALDA